MGISNRSDIIRGGGPRPFLAGLSLTFAVALAAALLSGCASENEFPEPGTGDGVSAPIVVKAGGELAASLATRATDDKWGAAENIGVFAKNRTDGTYVHENVKHTYSGTSGQAAVTFSPAEGAEMRYLDKNALEFHAYAPYSETPEAITIDASKDFFTPAVDLMYASGAVGALKSGDTKTPSVIFDGETDADQTDGEAHGTKFRHVMAKVVVKLKPGKGVSADQIKNCKLWLDNVYAQELTWNAKTNQFSVTGMNFRGVDKIQVLGEGKVEKDGKSVGLSKTADADGYYTTDPIYLPPSTVDILSYHYFCVIVQPQDCQEMRAKIILNPSRFESGKSYEFKLTANLTNLEVNGCTIIPWESAIYSGDLGGNVVVPTVVGTGDNDYAPTKVGDLMFEDGSTLAWWRYDDRDFNKDSWKTDHGQPIGIVASLFNQNDVQCPQGASELLSKRGVTKPHGMVLSLRKSTQPWDNYFSTNGVVGSGYINSSAAYNNGIDGLKFMDLTANGKKISEYMSESTSFEAFRWCMVTLRSLYSPTYEWVDQKSTGWYLPSWREWVDMVATWAHATKSFTDPTGLITWLKDNTDGYDRTSEEYDGVADMWAMVAEWVEAGDGDPFVPEYYWTATQAYTGHHCVYTRFNAKSVGYWSRQKNDSGQTRAVLVF